MAGRIRAGGAAVILAAALVAGSAPVAFADPPPPSGSAAPTGSAAARALHDLAIRIVALQRTAEQAGKAAQKAGERSNDARAASDAAAARLTEARAAADAAAETARRSRARASAAAAQLARTNMGTLPLDLLLNGGSAEGVLGGLSTTGQLSVEARLLFDQAHDDQVEAERLQAVATAQAADAAAAATKAAKAYAAAKKVAASAKRAVTAALDDQRSLLAAASSEAGLCGEVGSAPVAACQPGSEAPPTGKSVGAKVVRFAESQIGKPYVFAAAGPNAYDCSGLTLAAYASAGVSIGLHSATAQYNLAAQQGDLVPLSHARPGDLLFYTDGGGDMYHVTIYAGGGLMLEAPYPGSTVRQAPIRSGDLVQQVAHFG